MGKIKDLTGKVYGRLTVVSYYGRINQNSYWNCVCDCGTAIRVCIANLHRSNTRSCGCLRKEVTIQRMTTHGETRHTKEHHTWMGMKERCHNPRSKVYHRYGGRGIFVCKRWLNSYENFLADMGRAPSTDHSIERKDNDKGYSKQNCKWATPKEQSNNRRSNIRITRNGVTKNLSQWCEDLGKKYTLVRERYREHGWDIERALFEPL